MRYGIFSFTFDGKYIDEQILLFDRYLLNEFDFYVINDSSFKLDIKNKLNKVKIINIPQRIHNIYNPSYCYSSTLNYVTHNILPNITNIDYAIYIHSDVFIFDYLSLDNIVENYDIICLFDNRQINNRLIQYIYPNLLFINTLTNKLNDIDFGICNFYISQELNIIKTCTNIEDIHTDIKDGSYIAGDTGALTFNYLQNNKLKIKLLPCSSWTESIFLNNINNLADKYNIKNRGSIFLTFYHLVNGSSWINRLDGLNTNQKICKFFKYINHFRYYRDFYNMLNIFSITPSDKIALCSFTVTHDFIKYQYDLCNKFIQNKFIYITIDDSYKENEKNNIINLTTALKINRLRIPQNIHKYQSGSHCLADCLNYIFKLFLSKFDMMLFFHTDLFPFNNININNIITHHHITATVESLYLNNTLYTHIYPALVIINNKKCNHFKNVIDFSCYQTNHGNLDTGGMTYILFGLENFSIKLLHHTQQFNNSHSNNINYLKFSNYIKLDQSICDRYNKLMYNKHKKNKGWVSNDFYHLIDGAKWNVPIYSNININGIDKNKLFYVIYIQRLFRQKIYNRYMDCFYKRKYLLHYFYQ